MEKFYNFRVEDKHFVQFGSITILLFEKTALREF